MMQETETLTSGQLEIVDRMVAFYKQGVPHSQLVVGGLAGSGKTTALVYGVEALQQAGARVAICAPTGKAAHVINQKQNVFTATTIHRRLTARPYDDAAPLIAKLEKFDHKKELTDADRAEIQALLEEIDLLKASGKNNLNFEPVDIETFCAEFDVIVFDETSMIGKYHTYDKFISRLPLPYIFFGDKAQLPPVSTPDRPEVPAIDLTKAELTLDKVLRQAAGSDIISFSHHIHRRREYPPPSITQPYVDVDLYPSDTHDIAYENPFDIIIVHANKQRHALNCNLRALSAKKVGFVPNKRRMFLPTDGEQLFINKNVVDLGIMKGQLVTVKEIGDYVPQLNPYTLDMVVEDERGFERRFKANIQDMMQSYDDLPNYNKRAAEIAKARAVEVRLPYSITCHMSQGSEWQNVLVFNRFPPRRVTEWCQWIYTASTRAAVKLTVADQTLRFRRG